MYVKQYLLNNCTWNTSHTTLKEKYGLKFISEVLKMSIYQLPDELILKVLSYLEIKDFLSCGQGGVHAL